MGRHANDRSLRDFAEAYRTLHRRGLSHREIAEKLGYASGKTVARLVWRARTRLLLPPARHGCGCTCPLPAQTTRSMR